MARRTTGTIVAVPGMTAPLIMTLSAGCSTSPLGAQELWLQSPLLSPVGGGIGMNRSVHITPLASSTHYYSCLSPGQQMQMGHGLLAMMTMDCCCECQAHPNNRSVRLEEAHGLGSEIAYALEQK